MDPPVTVTITPGGSDEDMGAPSNAIGGGGFTNDVELSGTAWQMVAGTDGDERGQVENLEHLQSLLETSPEVVGTMLWDRWCDCVRRCSRSRVMPMQCTP